ncbi:MAG: DM13 domain-containing protein [Verrucomicrobiales bacterium]|nr:DM13 domain-containing protein [Verrucomicrobiales bacterium]MCP5524909.1 DM13 domain-containing protein [Verrucomicrobiales bacterium]
MDAQQAYENGIRTGDLLTGTAHSGDSVTVSLPEGQSLDGYNAISVWCVDFAINFGSGTFQP